MASEMVSLPDDVGYLLQRLAVQRHSTVDAVLAELVRAEADRCLPRVREGYLRRAHIAAALLQRSGIEPADGEFQRDITAARALLAQVDARETECGST